MEHYGIDAMTFTGSTAVGRAIAARLAARGVPFAGEMGGKNAAVVLADADLELAVERVVGGAFRAAGQKCTATSRVVVDDAVADEFLERFAERTAQSASETRSRMMLTWARSSTAAHATAYWRRSPGARDGRPRAPCTPEPYGSGVLAEGNFVPPTVFELTDERHPLWRDEVFGPVVAVRRASDTSDAMRLANDSVYGLSAALFTTRPRVERSPRSMTCMWACCTSTSESAGADLHVPFGGMKGSCPRPPRTGISSPRVRHGDDDGLPPGSLTGSPKTAAARRNGLR